MERYEAYKDSGVEWIGEIPAGWKVSKLGHCLSSNQGGIWGDDPENGNGTVVLRSTEQTIDGNWQIDEPAIRNLENEPNVEGKLLAVGDLLVTKSSGSELHIGKTTIVDERIEALRCSYSNFMQRLQTNEKLNPRFCWYLLNSDLARSQYCFLQNSTSGIGNLTANTIAEVRIPTPPISVQVAITSYLDAKTAEINALVANCEQEVELLQEYRKAVISEAVTKGLDSDAPMKDSGVEWIGEIPMEWEIMQLGRLCRRIFDGPFGSNLKSNDYVDEGVRVVRLENLKYLQFDETKESFVTPEKYETISQHTVYPEDLIVATFIIDSVKACRLPGNIGFAVNKADCLGVRTGEAIDVDFLKYYLSSSQVYDYLSRLTHGSTRQRINTTQLKALLTLLPPMSVQQDIVAHLDAKTAEIDALIDAKQKMADRLREYHKSLISEAVTGKFKVPNH